MQQGEELGVVRGIQKAADPFIKSLDRSASRRQPPKARS